ncbi:MAG: SCP2 sterol-binding domain-containing protein [Candidatus Eremiobacteraeota bacterium]|nr:SCP2 sterol-binding domain-containing protein [Candidatus Eremiobacteraeota bacterium]
MSVFRDSDHARAILGGFFSEESTEDDRLFAGSGMIVAYSLHDPQVRIVLDATNPPQPGKAYDVYVDDPAAPAARLEFTTDADTFDRLYKGEASGMSLMMSGKIKVSGDTSAAMQLIPALTRAIPKYKKYRETH